MGALESTKFKRGRIKPSRGYTHRRRDHKNRRLSEEGKSARIVLPPRVTSDLAAMRERKERSSAVCYFGDEAAND